MKHSSKISRTTWASMSLVYDHNGKPYLIVQEQEKKQKTRGIELQKKYIEEAKKVASTLKTSFGPKGMDKIMIDADGELTVTNDGATILGMMQFQSQIAKLLVSLSKSQDTEIGDGTTGVIVIAGGLLEQTESLLDKGIHPLKIAAGFEKACNIAVQRLEEIAERPSKEENIREILIKTAKTSLNSKVVSKCKEKFAETAVEAILSVWNSEKNNAEMDLIRIIGKEGGDTGEIQLLNGVLLEKEFSHPQMPSEVAAASIAILTCPFEPPKPKTKHKLEVGSTEEYQKLQKYETRIFAEMIQKLLDEHVTVAVCQWGFDDEANHLLVANKINAIRWVGGQEIEQLAIATGAKIIARFEDVQEARLGKAGSIRTIGSGSSTDKMLLVENSERRAVSIVVRGGNKMIVEEAKRSLHDSLCAVRNMQRDMRVVYGGGSAEIACSISVQAAAEKSTDEEQYALRAYAYGLEAVPLALSSNAGLDPMETLSQLRARQLAGEGSRLGVDCFEKGENDMQKQNVVETFQAKREQLILATQMVKMILKIDECIQVQSTQ